MVTHNKMLKTQISLVAQQQAAHPTPGGSFPGKPQPNPKGHANSIALRSRTAYDGPINPRLNKYLPRNNKPEPPKGNIVTTPEKQVVEEPVDPEKQRAGEIKDTQYKKLKTLDKAYVPPPTYKPQIPYPQRLKQTKDTQYKKFEKVIEKLHVEIPFTEAITQRKLEDPKPFKCNTIVENKLAIKQRDSRSLFIPRVLVSHVIDKALLDLGASVSLMPLAVCNRLNLRDMQPTRMSLQLGDRSIKYPIVILKDIQVRIGQLYIPTYFVITEIKEDEDIPILLGRPFLSTDGAMIVVKRGK
ncbi:uncharacterized protein LOC131651514 [Vicia villosa]|uniref:uncharacterized protein LOC131624941 n=1 Tax=Vicia villosa TaxID=3911 RepID=UPI00273CADF8|nr:uncharacterized protein LOC131624941 [Vicia villosa]XP_058777157.1 uncharacterized protein LOC131651514 [Vicia villosa]